MALFRRHSSRSGNTLQESEIAFLEEIMQELIVNKRYDHYKK